MARKRKFSGWIQLVIISIVVGFASTMTKGGVNLANSYMKSSNQVMMSATVFGIGASVFSLLQGPPQTLLGKLVSKYGSKKVLMVSTILGIIVCGFVSRFLNTDLSYILIYGICFGIVDMINAQIPAQTLINNWFHVRKGMAQSLHGWMTSIASIASPLIATWAIVKLGKGDFRYGYYIGAVFCLIGLIAVLFLKDRPEDVGEVPDGITETEMDEEKKGKKKVISTVYKRSNDVPGLTLKEALKMPIFWAMIVSSSLGFTVFTLINVVSAHFLALGYSLSDVSYAMSIGQVARLAAGFGIALLIDRIEPSIVAGVMSIFLAAAMFVGAATPGAWAVYVFFIFLYLYAPVLFSVNATLYGNYFGREHFSEIQGFQLTIGGLLSCTTGVVSGAIADATGSYAAALVIYGVLACVMVIVSIFFIGIPCMRKYKKTIVGRNMV